MSTTLIAPSTSPVVPAVLADATDRSPRRHQLSVLATVCAMLSVFTLVSLVDGMRFSTHDALGVTTWSLNAFDPVLGMVSSISGLVSLGLFAVLVYKKS
jgi:hypothetical protein